MDDDSTIDSLANALLGKEEEIKPDDKPVEEDKGQEQAKPDTEAEKVDEKPAEEEKPADDKPAEEKPADGDKPAADKVEGEPAKETPLTREDIRQAMREEQEAREAVSNERMSFAGKVRSDLKESLKLDSTYTTIALDDGTPIQSVSQLTQVINPETEEPYTREEAQSLIIEAKNIVAENLKSYEERVDQLTDLNVDFKEQADRVDELYGDILKAFPEEAKAWLAAYQKTFTVNKDGYVENVPISPLEFYEPIMRPYRNATDQLTQRQAEEKTAEEKAAKEAEIKAEQEDRSDLGGTAGAAQGKSNLLADALTAYGKDN